MKALTICQPFAHLVLPEAPGAMPPKRVENREWATAYRGLLLIHAGKSRAWLSVENVGGRSIDPRYGLAIDQLVFGAIVGVAHLVDCLHIDAIERGDADDRYPWIYEHAHVEGTYCWVLDRARRFERPIPYTGRQGLFDIPDQVLIENGMREAQEPLELVN